MLAASVQAKPSIVVDAEGYRIMVSQAATRVTLGVLLGSFLLLKSTGGHAQASWLANSAKVNCSLGGGATTPAPGAGQLGAIERRTF